jgi:hypothetical protein
VPQSPALEDLQQTVRYQMWTQPNMVMLRQQLTTPLEEEKARKIA